MAHRILLAKFLLATLLIIVSAGLMLNASSNQKSEAGYVIEAEKAVGQWKVGLVSYGRSGFYDPPKDLMIKAAYIDESSPENAKSQIEFTVPLPGYYLIGARVFSERREGFPIDVSVLLHDSEGDLIINQFENSKVGYFRSYNQGGWVMPVLGLWNIPEGKVKLTFRSHNGKERFMAIDHFYLTPIFATKSGPTVTLPITAWPASGEWISGSPAVWAVSSMAKSPNLPSSITYDVPITGNYAIYVTMWHPGKHQHTVNFEIESYESVESAQVTLSKGESLWQTMRLGSFRLREGKATVRFISQPSNHHNQRYLVVIEGFMIAPENRILTELSDLPSRGAKRGHIALDGLGDEWENLPTVVTDPKDTALKTDLRGLKAFTRDGFLYVLAKFYNLAEHPSAELEIDFEGDGRREFNFILPPEGEGAMMRDLREGVPFDLVPIKPARGAKAQTFDVIEMQVPLSLIEGRETFYIRYLMWLPAKPDYLLIDRTDWGLVTALE